MLIEYAITIVVVLAFVGILMLVNKRRYRAKPPIQQPQYPAPYPQQHPTQYGDTPQHP